VKLFNKLFLTLLLVCGVENINAKGANASSQLTFDEMTKSSSKLSYRCSRKTNSERNEISDKISSYINELDRRCKNVDAKSKQETACKLSKYRLKSDLLNCDKTDYYHNKD